MMFNPSLQEVRLFWGNTWKKFQQQQPLSDLEAKAAWIASQHPEYTSFLLATSESAPPENLSATNGISENPFLHLSLHLAVVEQLDIDQPLGIKALFESLVQVTNDQHAAWHIVMTCLAETLQKAQRSGTGLDAAAYWQQLKETVAAYRGKN